jgi:hypothetical protein
MEIHFSLGVATLVALMESHRRDRNRMMPVSDDSMEGDRLCVDHQEDGGAQPSRVDGRGIAVPGVSDALELHSPAASGRGRRSR